MVNDDVVDAPQSRPPKLYLMCGKIASGKSTLARRLAADSGAVLICQDRWLSKLYPGEISSLDDYRRCHARLCSVVGDHVASLLDAGVSVVLDFPANTLASRAWMRRLFEEVGAAHELHYLDVPDHICRKRLEERNTLREDEYEVSSEDFELFLSYFVAPTGVEEFDVIVHGDFSAGDNGRGED